MKLIIMTIASFGLLALFLGSTPTGSDILTLRSWYGMSDEKIGNQIANQQTLSNNADLSSLELTNCVLNPPFSPNTTFYTAVVANTITNSVLSYTVAGQPSQIKITGLTLSIYGGPPFFLYHVGANYLSIELTAKDGTIKTYRVQVTRLPDLPTPTHVPNPPDVPEGDSLILLAVGIGGLATWIAWQWKRIVRQSEN